MAEIDQSHRKVGLDKLVRPSSMVTLRLHEPHDQGQDYDSHRMESTDSITLYDINHKRSPILDMMVSMGLDSMVLVSIQASTFGITNTKQCMMKLLMSMVYLILAW